MKAAVLCLLFIGAAWSLPKGHNEPQFKRLYVDPSVEGLPKDLIPRITNGREAVPHSIPYQAYLIVTASNGLRWLCGGSLISDRHVLTAGHCVDDGVSAVVYLGAHNLLAAEPTRIIVESRNLIRHENYNENTISDDIGVIVLDEPVKLDENINVAKLPSRRDADFEGANARVSGWGRVTGDGSTSSVLLEVNSTVISNAQCKQIYSIVISSQLCISGVGGVGSCNGDSGGPLVADDRQIGIVSYGASGCPPGYPSAFTRVTSYLDWLEKKTGISF